ncbi:MAG: hypothetical protein QG656_1008 [Candidatus Hydrogenedentes bacterium]|nr:hypothetical protein [Candidatus Hydrogenedentota bacterium]
MTDQWDIAKYVENHPDDYEQRWRLAKKLYQSGEHRLAVEHLQVLRNEWVPKITVARYLAASQYRLHRYAEAAQTLAQAIEVWPDDVGLFEQLARVLEVSGEKEEAAGVWDRVLKLSPNHPSAKQQAARLRAPESGSTQPQPVRDGQDSALMTAPKMICPACGAENSKAFRECWKCHAPLSPDPTRTPITTPPPAAPRRVAAFEAAEPASPVWLWVGALGLIALLTPGVYMTLQYVDLARQQAAGELVIRNAYGALAVGLLLGRLIAGLALLVTWPAALYIAFKAIKTPDVPGAHTAVWGLFLAALTYLVSFAPSSMIAVAPLAPAAVSFVVLLLVFRLSLPAVLITWPIQGLVAGAVVVVSFISMEGLGPVMEFPAIARYVAAHDKAENPGAYPLATVALPANIEVSWKSTGSPWFDSKTGRIELSVASGSDGALTMVELRNDAETLVYQQPEANPFACKATVKPGGPYHLALSGQTGAEVDIRVYGVLEPAVAE